MYNLIQFYGIKIKKFVVCITWNPKITIFIFYSIQDVLINLEYIKLIENILLNLRELISLLLVSKICLSKSVLSLAYLFFIGTSSYIEKLLYFTLKGHIATT